MTTSEPTARGPPVARALTRFNETKHRAAGIRPVLCRSTLGKQSIP